VSSKLGALLLAASVFAVDRVSKVWIERTVSIWDNHPVIAGFFDIVHTKNRGAAFGILADSDSMLRPIILVGVSLAVLIFIAVLIVKPNSKSEPASKLSSNGLALILGGALGNIYDRLMHGMVTDFLDFYLGVHHFPAFNVADAAISVGAALLLLDTWLTRGQTNVSKAN
jgi:signal peptidase II